MYEPTLSWYRVILKVFVDITIKFRESLSMVELILL